MRWSSIKKPEGFTLIELLVVISIISLLSAVVLAGMKSAKDKADASALVQSFRQIQIALEQYKNDTGYYPYENSVASSWSKYNTIDNLTSALTTIPSQKSFLPTYINKIPQPLSNPSDYYTYLDYASALSVWGLYTCGGKPIKGYLFVYYPSSQTVKLINLPTLNFVSSNVFYCITAN